MKRAILLCGSIFLGCASTMENTDQRGEVQAGTVAPSNDAHFLSPEEILDRVKASRIQYSIEKVKGQRPVEWASTLWPKSRPGLKQPRVGSPGGEATVDEWPMDEETEQRILQAEKTFEARRWGEAKAEFLSAFERDPNCYLALLFAGDAAVFGGDYAAGLELYRKAEQLNPYDFRVHFFQSTALRYLGKLDEVRETMIRALSLRPRYGILMKILDCCAEGVNIQPDIDPIYPAVTVERQASGVALSIMANAGPHWMAYGTCKAYWLGERRTSRGLGGGVWSLQEEMECLGGLAILYAQGRKQGVALPEPALDRLVLAIQAKLLRAFVLYEIAGQMDPDILLRAGDEERGQVLDYLRRLVIKPLPKAEPQRPNSQPSKPRPSPLAAPA